MIVELISVGTEILLGNIVNTNANYLSQACAMLGMSLYYQVVVGDNPGRLLDTIKTALSRSDIIILTGGLGPTQDDLTKETTARAIGRSLCMDERSKHRILEYFNTIYKSGTYGSSDNEAGINDAVTAAYARITDNNWKQAMTIEGSLVLDNDNGTAPGYIVEDKGKLIILLPGPPNEMKPMFEAHVLPHLKKLTDRTFVSRMVKICGIGESRAETMILDLIEQQDNPTIAPYAKTGEVHIRITASAHDEEEANRLLQPVLDKLTERFGDNIYTLDEKETLESVVIKLLANRGLNLSVAESCTGGLLASRIVSIPGASMVFNTGFVTYSNEAKRKNLGVKEKTLGKYGAVSSQTVREMAEGACLATGSSVSAAITGIAGPGGGTAEKPVGLVYIACRVNGETTVRELHLKGSRDKIREQSVIYTLDLIRRCLLASDS
jgi:nicotinamide-nucleotide amidase